MGDKQMMSHTGESPVAGFERMNVCLRVTEAGGIDILHNFTRPCGRWLIQKREHAKANDGFGYFSVARHVTPAVRLHLDRPRLASHAYTLIRTDDGGVTVTVCQGKAGTDQSLQLARDWIQHNASNLGTSPPTVSEGAVVLQLSLGTGGLQERRRPRPSTGLVRQHELTARRHGRAMDDPIADAMPAIAFVRLLEGGGRCPPSGTTLRVQAKLLRGRRRH